MQVMFTVPRVFVAQNVIRQPVRGKITKGEIMKRLHKENKAEFGRLIETRKEKAAREKRESKTVPYKQSALDLSRKKAPIDTEAHYISNSKGHELIKIKFMGRFTPYYTKKILRIVKSEPVEVSEKSETIPTVEEPKPIIDAENSQSETEFTKSDGNSGEKSSLPSKILINRMTSFSYLESRKNALENLNDRKLLSISPYSDKTKLSIPSVTRILNKTMSAESKLNLELWKQRMILKLGQEGFEKYSQELLLYGKQFHSSIQNHLTREPFEVPPTVEKSWQSVQHVLKEVNDVHVIESHAIHSKLYYRGVVDCVAMYRGNLCVIDWKKSDKAKNLIENTFDAPIQVASYIGALNSDSNYNFQAIRIPKIIRRIPLDLKNKLNISLVFSCEATRGPSLAQKSLAALGIFDLPNLTLKTIGTYPIIFKVENGLVVVGYTNGDPASVHEINPTLLNKYWKLWLRRLQQYYVDLTSAE